MDVRVRLRKLEASYKDEESIGRVLLSRRVL